MTTNPIQNVQQAIVKEGIALRPIQNPVQLELFDVEGNPWTGGGGVGTLPEDVVRTEDLEAYATVETVNALTQRVEALENTETGG